LSRTRSSSRSRNRESLFHRADTLPASRSSRHDADGRLFSTDAILHSTASAWLLLAPVAARRLFRVSVVTGALDVSARAHVLWQRLSGGCAVVDCGVLASCMAMHPRLGAASPTTKVPLARAASQRPVSAGALLRERVCTHEARVAVSGRLWAAEGRAARWERGAGGSRRTERGARQRSAAGH
jgi:hypothetical protein